MPRVEVLVGTIAAGKSTYATRRANEGAIVVSQDDLLQGFHRRHHYDKSLRDFYRCAQVEIVHAALDIGLDVVIDDTSLTKENRRRWLTINEIREEPVRVVAVVFPHVTPEEHALRRFNHDPRGYSLDYWEKVARSKAFIMLQEPLTEDEGFSEIVYL